MSKHKIILWDFPLYSHTLSYIWAGFEKSARYLNHEVYWFTEDNHPDHNDPIYKDATFIAEGSRDKKLPIRSDCAYIIHSIHPDRVKSKYLGNVGRFVDLRYNHVWHHDEVYQFKVDKKSLEKIGPCCYLDESGDYTKVYCSWATDLLPSEFNYADIYKQREKFPTIYFLGTISNQGRCENWSKIEPFVNSCKTARVEWVHNDPWVRPLSMDQVKYFTQKSIIAPDIRGPELLRNGYVPCRLFKNISYGHLGITNSEECYKELEGNCLLVEDTSKMLNLGLHNRDNYSFIESAMKYVAENHTYVNRLNDLLLVASS